MKILFYAIGGLLFISGILTALKLIPPNRFFGFRTERVLSDETIWYAVNQRVGFGQMIGSLVIFAGLYFIYSQNYSHDKEMIYATILTVICAVFPLLLAL